MDGEFGASSVGWSSLEESHALVAKISVGCVLPSSRYLTAPNGCLRMTMWKHQSLGGPTTALLWWSAGPGSQEPSRLRRMGLHSISGRGQCQGNWAPLERPCPGWSHQDQSRQKSFGFRNSRVALMDNQPAEQGLWLFLSVTLKPASGN